MNVTSQNSSTGPVCLAPPPHRRAVNFLCAHSAQTLEWRLLNAAHRGMTRRMAAAGVPGVQLSIGVDDRPVRTLAWGLADAERREPMREDTRFRMASLAKPIAALVMLRLIARGTFDLDEPLTPLLADMVPTGLTGTVTARSLMSHSAGLGATNPPHLPVDSPMPSLAGVLRGGAGADYVPRCADKGAPASEYTGAGWMLLEHAITRRTGRGFADVADELLAHPLALRARSFHIGARTGPGIASEHDAQGRVLPITASPALAATGLVSNTRDMVAASTALIRAAQGLAPEFLPARLAREAVSPQPHGAPNTTFTLTHFLFARQPVTLTHGGVPAGVEVHGERVSGQGISAAFAANADEGLEPIKPWLGLLGAMALARGADARAR